MWRWWRSLRYQVLDCAATPAEDLDLPQAKCVCVVLSTSWFLVVVCEFKDDLSS